MAIEYLFMKRGENGRSMYRPFCIFRLFSERERTDE